MFARLNLVSSFLGPSRQFFPPLCRARELPRDIGKFLYSPADLPNIAGYARAAVTLDLVGSPLVPIEASGLDHLVQQPSLLLPALHFSLGLRAHRDCLALSSGRYRSGAFPP